MTSGESEHFANEEADTATKRMTVGEVMNIVHEELCLIDVSADLFQIAEGIVKSHAEQTAAVVEAEGRLVGLVPFRLVLDELFLDIAPEEFLASLSKPGGVEEFGKISRATTAGELMQEPVYLTVGETARDAFVKMHKHGLDGLPVVDDDMHILGYVSIYELMRVWLRSRSRKAQ